MKTFEEYKESCTEEITRDLQYAVNQCDDPKVSIHTKYKLRGFIEAQEKMLRNIDEFAVMEIGSTTNDLIEQIQLAYQLYPDEYFKDPESFITNRIIGYTPDGKRLDRTSYGLGQCIELGITLNDLSFLKDRRPVDQETADMLRKNVNNILGTDIPLSGVEEQALKDYESSEDELSKAEAYVRLKELQRNSGKLKNGGTYFFLADNQNYQEAKAMCSGRQL